MAAPKGRIIFVVVTIFVIYFLFIATPASRSEKEYRQRTEDGLARRHSKLQGAISDAEWTRQTNAKLQAILDGHPHGSRGRANGESNGGWFGKDEEGDDEEEEEKTRVADTGNAGRHRSHHLQNGHSDHGRPKYSRPSGVNIANDNVRDQLQGGAASKDKDASDLGKDKAREELQAYLKNPVVIFSKSYCPYSKKTKQLLTEIYTITPTPEIVELDLLTEPIPSSPDNGDGDNENTVQLGRKIQDLLADITGRRTVPNIILGGMHSIGGNDQIWEMHDKDTLIAEVQRLVGKRVTIELNHDYAEGGGEGTATETGGKTTGAGGRRMKRR